MIDVALKVGELTGGMAEGSIVTFQRNEEPLSRHMKTVFAMLRLNEDQLSIVSESLQSTHRSPRKFRIPLRSLAHALSRPGLECQWRSREPVEPADASHLNLRRLIKCGYKVRRPKHPDLNAVALGKYTVGKKASYVDWNAALADIHTAIAGTLIFTQISDLSYVMAGVTGHISLSSPNAKIIFKSASPLKGNAGPGLFIEDTSRTSVGFRVKASASTANAAAYIEMKDLYFRTASGANPVTSYPFVEIEGWNPGNRPLFKVHDCIFYGNSQLGHGILRLDIDTRFQCWNCKFLDLGDRAMYIIQTGNDDSFIENCTTKNNLFGIYQNVDDSIKVNNCVSVNDQTGFRIITPQGTKGDNNVSEDSSAAKFDGDNNLADQTGLDLEFENVSSPPTTPGFYRLKPAASLLPAAGKAPEIPDNIAGCKGNSRPGTDEKYSVGADELEELFPNNWNIFTKLTINAEKISGSTPFNIAVLITQRAFMITGEIWNNSRDDGGDLRLTTGEDGSGILPIEVVSWDRANRKCEIWALVQVDPTQDVELYLWAGNTYAAQPEFHDSRDNRGRFYVWETFPTAQMFVYHCANDISEKFVYDSSPAKLHAPVYSSPLPQIDSPWGYGKALEFKESLSYRLDFGSVYEFTDSAQHGFGIMHVQKITTTGGQLMRFDANGETTRRVELKDQGVPQGFGISAAAPDGDAVQTHFSNKTLSDLQKHILGARIDLGDKEIDSWVDGVKASSTGLSFSASSFSSGTHDRAIIGGEVGGAYVHFYAQEIRYWSAQYFLSENDAFWQTYYAMINEQGAFWSCGNLYGQFQIGPRKWEFLVPEVGCLGVENTDFWVEYSTNIDGTMSAILHAVWDAGSGTSLTGIAKRVELERRLEELRHIYETLRGDLLIDGGSVYEKLIRDVQLSAVTIKEGKTNAALDYDLTFVIGLAGLGMRSIARSLEFGAVVLNAGNFLIEYAGGDRTVFKDVFRAASIRIPSGPNVKSIFVTAIVESIAANTPLARRQKAEQKIKEWAWDRLGTEGVLKIDGASLGTAHLASVQPSNLELPDAIVFDLEFITGYGS